jgi:hypothetical protein
MVTDEQIKSDLVGDSGIGVTRALVMAVKSLTRWPVDAFFADGLGTDQEIVGWIQGDLLGVIRGEGVVDEGHLRADLYPLSKVESLRVDVNVVEDGMRLKSLRAVTVTFGPDEALTIDVGSFKNLHFRSRANEFVDTLLLRLSGLLSNS